MVFFIGRGHWPGRFWQIRTNLQSEFRQIRTYLAGGFWYANAQACNHVDLAIVGVAIENAGEFEGGATDYPNLCAALECDSGAPCETNILIYTQL